MTERCEDRDKNHAVQVAETTTNFNEVIQEAGGKISQQILDMPVKVFIATIAAQNGIRFTYEKPPCEIK
jgi:predicted enzyme related to lactoylglutathione lyase